MNLARSFSIVSWIHHINHVKVKNDIETVDRKGSKTATKDDTKGTKVTTKDDKTDKIKVIDNGSIKCISSSGSEAPIHIEKVEEPENELTPKDVTDVVTRKAPEEPSYGPEKQLKLLLIKSKIESKKRRKVIKNKVNEMKIMILLLMLKPKILMLGLPWTRLEVNSMGLKNGS